MSCCTIATKIKRSKTVVNIFLKLKNNYGLKSTGKRSKPLYLCDERRIYILASTRKNSTKKLIQNTELNTCRKTMYNTFRRSGRYIL